MAKFEADIPSYLKSGAVAVPIDNNFEKNTSQPQNLSEVIDNYANNFSGGIKTPDNLVSDDTPVDKTYGERPAMEENEILTTPMLNPTQIKKPQVQEVNIPQKKLTDDDILIA